MYALLIGVNAGAWIWALIAFHHYPVLLGTALLAYTFGLRHAVDADHIAAIDNVTRKLMQESKRPVAVGFFFSLGHSTVVFDGTDRVTAAGVSAGLDLGFQLVRHYRGDFYAKGMELLGEYDPQPPFPGGGNPRTADKTVVEMLNLMHAPIVEKFRAVIQTAKTKSG